MMGKLKTKDFDLFDIRIEEDSLNTQTIDDIFRGR